MFHLYYCFFETSTVMPTDSKVYACCFKRTHTSKLLQSGFYKISAVSMKPPTASAVYRDSAVKALNSINK